MALYGVTDADEAKPKWAVRGSGVDPQNIFATADGWVLRHYKNTAKTAFWDEILVSVDGIVGAGGIGYDLQSSFRMFEYDRVSAIIILIFVTIFIIDHLSAFIRSKIKLSLIHI